MNKEQLITIYRKTIQSWSRAKDITSYHDCFQEVLQESSLTYDQVRDSIVHLLSEPLTDDDAKFVEAAFNLFDLVGWPQDWLKIASRLLLDTHHQMHEEIIRFMQYYADPDSVPILRKAIALKTQLKYLEYDDYGAYYKKCLWALQDIGTEEALIVIRECTNSEDPVLKEQAEYRLTKIGDAEEFLS